MHTDTHQFERHMALLRSDPANPALYRACVDAAMKTRQFDVVLQLADERLKIAPGDPGSVFDKASGCIGLRDYRAALAALAELQTVPEARPAADLNIGLCRYCLGEFDLARQPLEACYERGQCDAGLIRLLVSTYHHLGLIDEALAIAEANQDAGKADAALAGVYALLYLDADDAARATRWAATTLQLNPRSVDGRVTQATLMTARLQTDKARRMLDEVIEDAPQTARAWIGLGVLDLLDRNLTRAKQLLSKGLDLMPQHVGSWHVLAWAQMMSGELDAAEQSFDRAMKLDRNFAETHGGLAAIAAVRGDRERAGRLMEVALRLDPECLSAKFAEAVLTGRAGDPQQAQKIVLDTVAGLSAKNGSALSQLLTKTRRH